MALADGLELKHRQLLSELEATRGREMGLNDTVGELKRHTTTLENALSRRETDIVELADKADRQGEALNQTLCQLQECSNLVVPVQSITTMAAPPPVCSSCLDLSAKVAWHSNNSAQMQQEVAKAWAELQLMKQNLAAESAKMVNERVAKDEALSGRRAAVENIERLSKELAGVRSQLTEAQHTIQLSQIDISQLRVHTASSDQSTSAEVQALQAVIRAMTNHLEMLSNELAQSKNETSLSQSSLAFLRGSLRGIIERHRMQDNLGSASIGSDFSTVNISEFEALLAERADEPVNHSKPLASVNNYLSILQQEINSLEAQVVQHALVINDNVSNWRSIEEESLLLRTNSTPTTRR